MMKPVYQLFVALAVLLCTTACERRQTAPSIDHTPDPAKKNISNSNSNPPADSFDLQNSDPEAVALADSVMLAMGGRQNWDNTRFASWNFFGFRKLWWDKFTGSVRVDYLKDDITALVNIHTGEGKVKKDGAVLTKPDSVKKYATEAVNAWINDSYWLFMPFKLKDSGVTLKYAGTDTVPESGPAHVLELRFKEVGVTPQNKYRVFVDKDNHLVTQWSYFQNAEDEEPRFTMPWRDYQQHGGILLSGNRVVRQITEIQVHEGLPETVFNSFDPVNLP